MNEKFIKTKVFALVNHELSEDEIYKDIVTCVLCGEKAYRYSENFRIGDARIFEGEKFHIAFVGIECAELFLKYFMKALWSKFGNKSEDMG